MVILLTIGVIFLLAFIYSALVSAKKADEYVYRDEEE